MTLYLTETDLVRALATECRRAADRADGLAADAALALALSDLDSDAVREAIILSENLERIAAVLRNQSLEIDDMEQTEVVAAGQVPEIREPN